MQPAQSLKRGDIVKLCSAAGTGRVLHPRFPHAGKRMRAHKNYQFIFKGEIGIVIAIQTKEDYNPNINNPTDYEYVLVLNQRNEIGWIWSEEVEPVTETTNNERRS